MTRFKNDLLSAGFVRSFSPEEIERCEAVAAMDGAMPSEANIECSLCGASMTLVLKPEVMACTCPSCGLRFEYDAHLRELLAAAEEAFEQAAEEEPDTLDRWLAGEPLQVADKTRVEELWEQGERYAPVMVMLAALFVVTLAVAIGGVVQYNGAKDHLEAMESQLAAVESERDQFAEEAQRKQSQAQTAKQTEQRALAEREEVEERLQREKEALQEEQERLRLLAEQEREQRLAAQRKVEELFQQQTVRQEENVALQVEDLLQECRNALDIDPGRSLSAARDAVRLLLSENRQIPQTIEQALRDALAVNGGLHLKGHERPIEAMALSRDGRLLLTGAGDNTARLWALSETGEASSCVVLRGHTDQVRAVAMSADGHWAVTGGKGGKVIAWDLTAEDPSEASYVVERYAQPVCFIEISGDSRWLITTSEGKTPQEVAARLWDLNLVEHRATPILLRGNSKPIRSVAVTPNSKWVVLGSEDHTVRLFDLGNPIHQVVLDGHRGTVTSIAVSADSRWMVTGSADNTARLWDLTKEDSPPSKELCGHEGWIESVAISPDGRWVATGSYDNTARLWNWRNKETFVLKGHRNRIRHVAFSPDGAWFITGSFDQTVALWRMQEASPSRTPVMLRGHKGPVSTLSVTPDSRRLITASGETPGVGDTAVRLWDLKLEGLLATVGRIGGEEELRPIERSAASDTVGMPGEVR